MNIEQLNRIFLKYPSDSALKKPLEVFIQHCSLSLNKGKSSNIRTITFSAIDDFKNKLFQKDRLFFNYHIEEFIRQTNMLLSQVMELQEYKLAAQKAHGASSTSMKNLGYVLLGLGLITALGLLSKVTIAGLAITLASMLLSAFFIARSAPHSFSKEMLDIADAYNSHSNSPH